MTPARVWLALWSGRYRVASVRDARGVRTLCLAPNPRGSLSPRQGEVARAAACGFASKKIALTLDLAESSVATYLAGACAKLGLDARGLRSLLPSGLLPDPLDLDATLEAPLPCPCPRGARWDGAAFAFPVPRADLPGSVTVAEREVLRGLLEGYRNEDIADARGTSARTVANQVTSLYRKLGVNARRELDPALLPALARGAA